MSNDMKLIMENWKANILEENNVLSIHEQLVQEFVNEIKTLNEEKAEMNEILAKIGDFAKRTYRTYSNMKKGAIKKVLEASINKALSLVPIIKRANSTVGSKIERVLNMLKQEQNIAVAISIISIIIGLATGEAFDLIEEVLNVIEAAPNIINAYETISNMKDTGKFAKATGKASELTSLASAAE
jgi:hypothetical protein